MDVTKTIFATIDLRSFSNLWFWISLAVLWSSLSHWVLGVPYDMVTEARRHGGQAADDMVAMTALNVRRIVRIGPVAGLWLVGVVAFALTLLGLLGFLYGIEIAQAFFLLAVPMTIVGALSLRAARAIDAGGYGAGEIADILGRHRITVQAIGMISIFVTALWGMWHNLAFGAV